MNDTRTPSGEGVASSLSVPRVGVLALGLALLASAGAHGQTIPYSAVASADFHSYQFLSPRAVTIERLSLSTLSFGAGARPIDGLWLELRGAHARGSLTRPDRPAAVVAGLTDTEIRADYSLPGDRFAVALGYRLPTGHSTHTLDETEVAGLIASDLLPFRVSNWGTGGGLALGGTFAAPVGEFGVGLRLGYTLHRAFAPLEDDDSSYRPGNALRAQLVVDRTIGTATKAALALDLQRSGDDAIAGVLAYRAGNWVQATGSLSFAAGWQSSGIAYLSVLRRDAGSVLPQTPDTASFLLGTRDAPTMHLVMAGTGVRTPFRHGVIVPGVDMRLFRRSDGFGQGGLAGVGTSVELPTGSLVLVPSLRGRFGRVVMWDGADSSVWGIELGFAVRGQGGLR